MSKFQALKTLLQDAIPAVAKEGEEAVASTIAKETEEKLAEDAAREAYKAEYTLPVAHGSSLEKIMTQKQAESGIIDPDWVPYRIKQFNDGTYPYIDSKTGAFHQLEPHEFPMISTLKPSTGWGAGYGEGVYTASQTPRGSEIGNYQNGFGEMSIPLRLRGKKVFNFADTFDERNPELKGLIPSRQESVSKLSKLSGVPEEEIHKLIRENWISKVNELVEKHPEEFESMYFDKLFKTFDPKNIRSPFAAFDPSKKDSSDFMAGLGAAALGAGALSSEAKAEPTKSPSDFTNIKKQLIKDYSPSFGSKEGDFSSYDESEALPTEGMQGRGLATIIRELVADKKPPSEFTPGDFSEGEYTGGGGIYGGNLLDPTILDFITPAGAIGAVKGVGKTASAIGKGAVEGAKVLGKKAEQKFPELTARILDNTGSIGGKESTLKDLTQVLPGMYSKAEKTVLDQMAPSAKPEQIYSVLQRKDPSGNISSAYPRQTTGLLSSAGVKPEEIEFLKIPQFLENKTSVTREELLDHIRKNLPNLDLVDFGENFSTTQTHPIRGNYAYKGVRFNAPVSEEISKKLVDDLKMFDADINDILEKRKILKIEEIQNDPEIQNAVLKVLEDRQKAVLSQKEKEGIQILENVYGVENPYASTSDDNQLKFYQNLLKLDTTHYGETPNVIGHYRRKVVTGPLDIIKENKTLVDLYEKEEKILQEIGDIENALMFNGENLSREERKRLKYEISKKQKEIVNIQKRFDEVQEEIENNYKPLEGTSYIMDEAQSQPHHKASLYGYIPFEEKKKLKPLISEFKNARAELKLADEQRDLALEKLDSFLNSNGIGPEAEKELVDRYAKKHNVERKDYDHHGIKFDLRWKIKDPEYIEEIKNLENKQKIIKSSDEYLQLKNEIDSSTNKLKESYDKKDKLENQINAIDKKIPSEIPFKRDAIYKLLSRLMSYEAAEKGAERVILPTGKTHAKRSGKGSLGLNEIKVERQAPVIEVDPVTKEKVEKQYYKISGTDEEGTIRSFPETELKNLMNIVPKEYLDEIKSALKNSDTATIKGDDLFLGSRRDRKIYDEVIPEDLKKTIRGEVRLGVVDPIVSNKYSMPSYKVGEDLVMNLTPEMRAKILKYGLPLWMAPFIMNQEEENSTPARPSFNNINKTLQK